MKAHCTDSLSADRVRPAMLEMGHHLCDLSRAAVLPHFRQVIPVENKAGQADFDPVTAADRAAERVIRDELQRKLPEHGIVGEEFGTHNADARDVWVIDPIDGTRGFITGSPIWGTLVGLISEGRPELGLLDQPFTGERFWSGADASYWRGADGTTTTLKTRACGSLGDAVLATTHPDLFKAGPEADTFQAIKNNARMSRYGGDCYAYALLAAGFIDIVIEAGLNSYDIVALIPIIERAGGRVTTWSGEAASNGGQIVACGDPQLHALALEALRPGVIAA